MDYVIKLLKSKNPTTRNIMAMVDKLTKCAFMISFKKNQNIQFKFIFIKKIINKP